MPQSCIQSPRHSRCTDSGAPPVPLRPRKARSGSWSDAGAWWSGDASQSCEPCFGVGTGPASLSCEPWQGLVRSLGLAHPVVHNGAGTLSHSTLASRPGSECVLNPVNSSPDPERVRDPSGALTLGALSEPSQEPVRPLAARFIVLPEASEMAAKAVAQSETPDKLACSDEPGRARTARLRTSQKSACQARVIKVTIFKDTSASQAFAAHSLAHSLQTHRSCVVRR